MTYVFTLHINPKVVNLLNKQDKYEYAPVRRGIRKFVPCNYLHFFYSFSDIFHVFVCLKDFDPLADRRPSRVGDRDDEYKARRRQLIISPERHDPFAGKQSVSIAEMH